MNARVLIVDDEKEIVDLVELYLKNENFIVQKSPSPAAKNTVFPEIIRMASSSQLGKSETEFAGMRTP